MAQRNLGSVKATNASCPVFLEVWCEMFQGWRLKIREADEACQQGLLDQAQRTLVQGQLQRYAPGKRLCVRVAEGLAERALRRVRGGEWTAGLRDLESARKLSGATEAVTAARQELIHLSERQVRRDLEVNAVANALRMLEELQAFEVTSATLRRLHDVARCLQSTEQLCLRGEFVEASRQVSAALVVSDHWQALQDRQVEVHQLQGKHRKLTEKLHQALAAEKWNKVLKVAERLLEISPESVVAEDARRRAWNKVGARFPTALSLRPTEYWNAGQKQHRMDVALPSGTAQELCDRAARFVLWVDAVGGYLVCLADEVMLGQAVPSSGVAVPIKADLSRRHAKVKRRGEGYLLEPLGKTRLAGQVIRETTLLTDGDEIELGEGVKLRFRQPHALSSTARLEFVSRHKTHPTADAVLLMAESCVLGPHWQNHVVARDWSSDVVLFRHEGGLFCRASDAISVDGVWHQGKGRMGANSRVCGDEFSMSVEEVLNV